LNEFVGFKVSFLTQTSPRPSASPSRSARTSGVNPAPRSTAWPRSTGNRSEYRQMLAGPLAMLSRLMLAVIAS
jgi:hypothetical protein